VPDVLSRAAVLLDERGWTPVRTYRSSDRRLTALAAITRAVDDATDSHGNVPLRTDDKGRTVYDSGDLLTDALDAVTRHVFGQRHGTSRKTGRVVSVSAWERDPGLTVTEIVAVLRDVAQARSRPGIPSP
jgi:hypothetical protein